MTVKDLIEFLQTHDPELPVAIAMYSEQTLLEADDIRLWKACVAREDGWVQDKRPDKEAVTYLLFPGN